MEKLIRKSNFFKKGFILLFTFVLAFLLFGNLNTNAATTCNATYQESKTLKTKSLAYGVKYKSASGLSKSTATGTMVPQVANMIQVPSIKGVVVTSWSNFQSSAWKMSRVTAIASNYELTHPGYKVIAVVNGDFYDISGDGNFPYQPVGVTVSDGNFYKSSPSSHSDYEVLSFTNDGTTNSLVSYSKANVGKNSTPTIAIYDNNDQIIKEYQANKVNKEPGNGEISVYYGTYASGKVYNPVTVAQATKVAVCDEATYSLPNSASDYYGIGKLTSFTAVELKKGSFAISSNNTELNSYLNQDVKVRVQYEWSGVQNVENAINAGTQILENGEAPSNVNTNDGSRMSARHPRTAIGVKKNGEIILCVNDGRQESDDRYGTYGNELAALMKEYGCINAYNLDGGGSSILYYRDGDTFVSGNKWSDASERSVSNAVIVAVKDPTIELSIVNAETSNITVSVNVLEKNGHDFDKLYVRIENTTVEVVNGIAEISGLEPLTKYRLYVLYVSKSGIDLDLNTVYDVATTQTQYKIKTLEIDDNDSSYTFTLKYSDRAKITNLATCNLYVNDKKYQLVEGSITINKTDFESIKEIKLEFECETIDGKKIITIYNPHAPFINVLRDTFILQNNLINSIYN